VVIVGFVDHVDTFRENALRSNVEGCFGVVDGGWVVEGVWMADEGICRGLCVLG
jgi:hypothetical protein